MVTTDNLHNKIVKYLKNKLLGTKLYKDLNSSVIEDLIAEILSIILYNISVNQTECTYEKVLFNNTTPYIKENYENTTYIVQEVYCITIEKYGRIFVTISYSQDTKLVGKVYLSYAVIENNYRSMYNDEIFMKSLW